MSNTSPGVKISVIAKWAEERLACLCSAGKAIPSPSCQFLYLQIPLHINSLIFAPISLSPIFPSHVLYPSPLIFSTPCISLRPLHPPKLPSKAINNLWPPLRSQKRNKSMIKKFWKEESYWELFLYYSIEPWLESQSYICWQPETASELSLQCALFPHFPDLRKNF